MILKEPVELSDIIINGNKFYPDMVKFCIDRKRRVVCIDEEMHIDMEHVLYDDGSAYSDIYGGNILISDDSKKLEWSAHPNVERNRALGGRGRLLTDENVITELTDILHEWVK